MVRVDFQVGKQERLPAWLVAAAVWFHRHGDGIDLFQLFRVIELQYPSFLGYAVLIQYAKARSLLFVKTATAPCLKRAGAFKPGLLVEIVRIENERLSFGVEDSPIRFLRLPIARNVIDLGNIKVSSPH